MTGWRLGFVCGHSDLIKRVIKIHQYCALCAPTMAQYAAIEALRSAEKEIKKIQKQSVRVLDQDQKHLHLNQQQNQ